MHELHALVGTPCFAPDLPAQDLVIKPSTPGRKIKHADCSAHQRRLCQTINKPSDPAVSAYIAKAPYRIADSA